VKERTYQLVIDGIPIIVTKKRMKNVYLRVKRDGTVTISAPHGMPDGDIQRFAMERMPWIKKHMTQYKLKSEGAAPKRELSERELNERKADLKHRVELLVAQWEPVMGVVVSGITIRKMKTRWGSCNVKTHHININLALWDKPEQCLQYVVIHEMAHLLEPSHNKVFWGYVSRYCPNWKQIRRYLNDIGI
jgi:predicted metal-dependent hydrolase